MATGDKYNDSVGGPPFEVPAPKGWECPKCKRVHGPSVKTCPFCSSITEDTSDTMEFLNE
jgi:hypothetical protein